MDRNERIRDLFDRAVDLSPEQRARFLERECDNEEIRSEVARYLLAHDDPAAQLAVPMVNQPSIVAALGESIAEFRLLHKIGEGGMGEVYLAEDTVLKRQVALKILSPRYMASERALGRFRHEAQAAARLAHPGIVRVFSYGEDEGTHYIAMEYIAGQTLARRLDTLLRPTLIPQHEGSQDAATATLAAPTTKAVGSITYLNDAARLTVTLADALEYAHQNNVIHRDVKPSNILIDKDGGAHLTDFGIARIIDAEPLTLTNEFAGTCYYASPEQAASKRAAIDHRSDVFSLGIVLYEMLTLCRPFVGDTPQQILDAVCTREPINARKRNTSIPRDLAIVCHKALEKLPIDRYQSAAHMAADLRCFLRNDPILARSPGMYRKLKKWTYRNRARAAFATTLGLLSIMMIMVWSDYQRRQSAMGILAVASEPDRCDLLIQQVDLENGLLGPARLLGQTPLVDQRLIPGQYRLTLLHEDGRFQETSVALHGPGDEVRLQLSLRRHDEHLLDKMVEVPAGEYTLGRPNDDPTFPERRVRLPAYWIDQHSVSNADYQAFLDATRHSEPHHWQALAQLPDHHNLPVVGITWEDAQAYARWRGKRLATADEWEAAARYPDGRLLPWGDGKPAPRGVELTLAAIDAADTGKPARQLEAYLAHVRSVSADSMPSALGLHFALGNVWEFTERRTPKGYLLKGSPWTKPDGSIDLSQHVLIPYGGHSLRYGFRCALSARSVSVESPASRKEP